MLAIIVDFETLAGKGDEVREVLQLQARNSLERILRQSIEPLRRNSTSSRSR